MSFREPVLKIYSHIDSLSRNAELVRRDSLKTIDLLFDPTILPATLMPLRNEYLSLAWISMINYFYNGICICHYHYNGGLSGTHLSAFHHLLSEQASLPVNLLPRKDKRLSAECLALFRSLCRRGNLSEARRVYHLAIRVYPTHLFHLRHVSKYVRTTARLVWSILR